MIVMWIKTSKPSVVQVHQLCIQLNRKMQQTACEPGTQHSAQLFFICNKYTKDVNFHIFKLLCLNDRVDLTVVLYHNFMRFKHKAGQLVGRTARHFSMPSCVFMPAPNYKGQCSHIFQQYYHCNPFKNRCAPCCTILRFEHRSEQPELYGIIILLDLVVDLNPAQPSRSPKGKEMRKGLDFL